MIIFEKISLQKYCKRFVVKVKVGLHPLLWKVRFSLNVSKIFDNTAVLRIIRGQCRNLNNVDKTHLVLLVRKASRATAGM